MTKWLKLSLLGAVGYAVVEMLYRGRTHWTMMLTGGICMVLLYALNKRMKKRNFLLRCVLGGLVITTVELAMGLVVNRLFCLNVWDYSGMRFNVLGQICPQFTLAWMLLCIPVLLYCTLLEGYYEKPLKTAQKCVKQ